MTMNLKERKRFEKNLKPGDWVTLLHEDPHGMFVPIKSKLMVQEIRRGAGRSGMDMVDVVPEWDHYPYGIFHLRPYGIIETSGPGGCPSGRCHPGGKRPTLSSIEYILTLLYGAINEIAEGAMPKIPPTDRELSASLSIIENNIEEAAKILERIKIEVYDG